MVDAVPITPAVKLSTLFTNTKVAPKDAAVGGTEERDPEVLTAMIFEDLAATELINIVRHDLVNGQDVIYSPIKNLSTINRQYNPNNLIALQDSSDVVFKNFPIKFEDFLPEVGSGPNGEIVYLEESTGNVIINVVDLPSNYQVEVQIVNSGAVADGTIY